MDYKEKYEQALKRAKELLEGMDKGDYFASNGDIENIFPELKAKESEDERIRKTIIRILKGEIGYTSKEDIDKYVTWLEKQDSQNSIPIDKAVNFLNEQLINDNDEITGEPFINFQNHGAFKETFISFFKEKMFEKQREKKPADKVEPKFKVGDWITNGNDTWKIVGVRSLDYILQSQDGNIIDDTISYVDEQFHSFTIEDAKDGNVLVDEDNNIGIYVGKKDDFWHSCIYLGCDSCLHKIGGYHTHKNTKPSTKEQRDLLFQKMKEAGYEWDSEKKELKKIEVTSKESEDERIKDEILRLVSISGNGNQYEEIRGWIEKQGEKLDADKVIAWLVANILDYEYFVKLFKKDFGL